MRAFAVVLASACATAPAPAGPVVVEAGPLSLRVSQSRTAQLFHIVDQLAAWSPYCHKQYERWFAAHAPLGDEARRWLAAHRELRAVHGWNGPLEKAFYTDAPVEAAARAAVEAGVLGAADAARELAVLRGLEPVIAPLLDAEAASVARLAAELAGLAEVLDRQVRAAAVMLEVNERVALPVYVIANPDRVSSGGGYYGNAIAVEVHASWAAATMVHESVHALMRARSADLDATVVACGNDLDRETLEEGLVYALTPALTGRSDIAGTLQRARADNRPATDRYVRFNRLASLLEGPMAQALRTPPGMRAVLDNACAAWRSVVAAPWP
jgi:hypothetical protein